MADTPANMWLKLSDLALDAKRFLRRDKSDAITIRDQYPRRIMLDRHYSRDATRRLWKAMDGHPTNYSGIIEALNEGADPNSLHTCNFIDSPEPFLHRFVYLQTSNSSAERNEEWLRQTKKILQLLVDKGADINFVYNGATYLSSIRETALWPAYSEPDLLRFMVSLGADVNAQNHEGRTLISRGHKPESNFILIDAGIDLTLKDAGGNSWLDHWTKVFREQYIKDFIQYGMAHGRGHDLLKFRERIEPLLDDKHRKIWDDHLDPAPIIRREAHAASHGSAVARYMEAANRKAAAPQMPGRQDDGVVGRSRT